MSELRMYVERLFEGRVLTSEAIELKEEIYGNLMARYEDYKAEGMDDAEALERTKASITSVDDVLGSREPAAAPVPEAPQASEPSAPDDPKPVPAAGPVPPEPGTPKPPAPEPPDPGTAKAPAPKPEAPKPPAPEPPAPAGPVPPTGAPEPPAPGGPVPPATAPGTPALADSEPPHRRRLKIAAIAVGVILVVLIAFGLVYEFIIDPVQDHVEDVREAEATQSWIDGQNERNGQSGQSSNQDSGQGSTNSGQSSSQNGTSGLVFEDAEDQREYEATQALLTEISSHDPATLQAFVGQGVPSQEFFTSLPLGANVSAADFDQTLQSVTVSCDDVPGEIDGDAMESALVYDAACAFSVYPDLQTVTYIVTEAYDDPGDRDAYSFDRASFEGMVSTASDGSITSLDSSLCHDHDRWESLRGCVTHRHFHDRAAELAEIG